MEVYLSQILENGGVVGAVVVTAVLVAGVLLRSKGFLSSAGSDQRLSSDALDKLSGRVSQLDNRLSQVERDIAHLPTRAEMHQVELAMTRLQGRMDGLEKLSAATNHAVSRIENFMIEISKRGK